MVYLSLPRLAKAASTLTLLLFASSSALAEPLTFKRSINIQEHPDPSQNREAFRFLPPAQASLGNGDPDVEDDLELLDIALVASVDGKFHALNRASGQVLWSMSSSSSPSNAPNASNVLGPMIQTQHVDSDSDPRHEARPSSTSSDISQELYIIEPQSGDIYVLPSNNQNAPLQRLPFSMAQLVDMVPFALPGDDEHGHRMFTGRKESSLLILELETGRVKGTVNAECPWDWDPLAEKSEKDREVDLDELEAEWEDGPKKTAPVSTEVLIGRTDYTVLIHTKSRDPSLPHPPVQTLTFSTYGPNNQDHILQHSYHRSPDDTYIQPMANGEVMAFRASPLRDEKKGSEEDDRTDMQPVWGNTFHSPIIAVFDVLRTSSRSSSLVLLQPKPRLSDFGFIPPSSSSTDEMDLSATYIGMVEETRSLYALSPENFPLVVFAPPNIYFFAKRRKELATIDAPPDYVPDPDVELNYEDSDLPETLDAVTQHLKDRAAALKCLRGTSGVGAPAPGKGGKWDRECLVGKRPVAASSQSRLSRLLPDRPWPAENVYATPGRGVRSRSREGLGSPKAISNYSDEERAREDEEGVGSLLGGKAQKLSSSALALLLVLFSLWFFSRSRVEKGAPNPMPTPTFAAAEKGVPEADEVFTKDFTTVRAPNPSTSAISMQSQSEADTTSKDDFVIVPSPSASGSAPTTPLVNGNGKPQPQSPAPSSASPAANGINDVNNVNGGGAEEDSEGEDQADAAGEGGAAPEKKKGTRRRRRGKKNKSDKAAGSGDVESKEAEKNGEDEEKKAAEKDKIGKTLVVLETPSAPAPTTTAGNGPLQLVVSEEVLGYGSHGTVVYRGSLQGRSVAVKRLLKDFVTLASREVSLLQESDDHPNVIRYYYQEAHANFLYIALELCPATLADVIEHPDQYRELSNAFDPKRAVKEVASGLRHLHALKIIHRDIKPQNILISQAKKGAGSMAGHRCLISDFGLCKRLEVDQTSFLPTAHGAMAAGTAGWRAPEILRGEVNVDEVTLVSDDSTLSSRGSTGTATGEPTSSPSTSKATRLTKNVDIFALGCLAYYVLTSGGHPYGDRFERDVNIIKDAKSLSGLESFGEEGLEAIDLIMKMLDFEASRRPDTSTTLAHPFFWTPARRLAFLQDASDRFEIMCRDPRDPDLIELERGAQGVVGNDWQGRLDRVFLDNLGKFRKYDGKSVQDLMRALRNKKHHYQDLPDNVKRHLGPLPEGLLGYFTRRFPHLFMHVHSVVARTNLRYESMFKSYFDPPD